MKTIKQIAMLAFVSLLTHCVWAATPVVVWDWDFDTAEKTGTDNQVYTLDLQGNSLENGCIKISQNVGATITPAQAARNGNYTIMIRYSNLKSVNHKAALISLSTTSSNIENIGVYAAANALKPSAYWDNNQTDYPLAEDLSIPIGAGYAQVAYSSGSALYFWADKTVVNDASKDAFANGLKFSSTTIDQIGIGGPVRATNANAPTAWDNVVIESVALYKGNYLAVSSTVGQTYTYGDMAYRATIESDGVAFADLTWKNATTGLTADYADIPANATIAILGSGSVVIPQDLSRIVYLGEHVTATLPESQATSATFVGRGAVAYTGAIPSTTQTAKFSSAADWKGTVLVKNYGTDNGSVVTSCLTGLKSYGNAGSKVKFSGVKGYTPDETASCPYELVLEDDGAAFSWRDDNGWSNRAQHTFAKLSGSGKILDGNGNNNQALVFTDVSSFVGTIDVRGKKITLGGSANLATANGGIAIANGITAKIADGVTWSTGVGGVKIDGTLKFTEQATTGDKANRLNTGNVSGSGTIDLTEAAGQSGKNLNIAFIGDRHSFSGDIKVPANVNCVFATSSVNVNDMQFSGGGFMCLYGATSAVIEGTWTTQTGAYVGTGATLTANGGTMTGRLYLCNNSNLVLGSLTETSLTVTGERFETAGTVHISLPSGTPSDDKVKLISWKKTQNVTAARLDVSNIPDGYEVTYDESGLYLSKIEDSTETVTSAVSNRLSLPIVRLGNGGVQKFTGVGGVIINDLQIRNGGKLVINPTRSPIKVTTKPVFESGAKLALDPEHAACTLGKFTLLTWTGDTITPAADLFDATSIPEGVTATLTCEATPNTANSYQLILTVGDYENSAKVIRIMPLGDSITDGTSKGDYYECNPNYRVPLMKKLAAKGYKPMAKGLRECAFDNRYATDSAGVVAPADYRWHSGVSGARVRTATTSANRGLNGGWREAIETTLDAAGDVDIVTFKIGTNDMGSQLGDIFAGWTNVVWRILNARPNVKIVCATITDYDGRTDDDTYNTMIKDQIALAPEAEGAFPAGRVFLADLNTACPRNTTPKGKYFKTSGDLHPNWEGHDLTSDEWLRVIESVAATMTFPLAENTFEKNTKVGAENNVPSEYRKGYIQLATKALPTTGQGTAMHNKTAEYDTTAEGAADLALARVAYYVELKNKTTGHVRYVWTSMDAFGDKTLAAVGLPTNYAKWGAVTNLRVVSNDSGIHNTGADAEGITGRLQFTYGGCSAGAQSGVTPAALIAKWDWNDTISGTEASPTGAYGIMQAYRVFDSPETDQNVAETLFAYNRWTATDSKPTEIGIGNFAMHGAYTEGDTSNGSLNYMFTSGYETVDASAYELMNLEIWGQLPAVTIEIPAAPTGAEVEVTVDGVVVDASSGSIEATPGAEIEVAYFAARDYNMDDVVFTFVAGEESTIDISQVVPVAKVYVAQIGTDGKKYETLQAAIKATEDGDTVYLIADTIETISTQFAAANITLHINEGVTLTGKEWYTIFNYQNTLTIAGKGAIVNAVNPSYSTAFYNQEGTLYVRGGTIEALKYIFQESSPVKTEVTGGKFNLNPRPWLANKYTTTKSSDNKYFVVEALTYVAKIDTTEYETLQGAIDAVTEGQLIELACSTTEEITFDKNFIVAIKSDGYNYGTITGAKGLWERWNGQYSNVALYVVISKSMESLVEHLTANISKYPGNHGRFYIYEDWTLSKDVRIPTVNDLSQSIFPVQNTFVLDLNGHTLDQAPVKSTHGGYPTIVAGHNTKVTIKDSSKDQTGILCGIGWAVDVYDNPNTSVTLESGTITTHGAEKKDSVDYHGRVIRLNGGSFIMNGGRITLEHLVEGNKIFGVITANTAVASTPHIEINGGYVQCATKDQLVSTNDPNCLIGGSKGPDSEVEITGGSFSIVPPKTYFAEGLDAVVDENGHFHIQTVVHEGDDVTIAVSDDGEKLAPAVPEEGSVEIIAPDETKVYVIDIAKQEAPAALYQVVTKDADGEVVSTSNIGVVKVEEKAQSKKTIAVAVPFTGATVENLVDTKLLNEGDELKAYIDGAYAMWSLDENGKWVSTQTVRAGGTETAPNAETTPLKRGSAVWVTTAGQVVTLGTFDAETEIVTEDKGVNLLGNPTMTALEPAAKTVGDNVVLMDNTRYTAYGTTDNKVWVTMQADENDPTVVRPVERNPSVEVGKGYWMIRK